MSKLTTTERLKEVANGFLLEMHKNVVAMEDDGYIDQDYIDTMYKIIYYMGTGEDPKLIKADAQELYEFINSHSDDNVLDKHLALFLENFIQFNTAKTILSLRSVWQKIKFWGILLIGGVAGFVLYNQYNPVETVNPFDTQTTNSVYDWQENSK